MKAPFFVEILSRNGDVRQRQQVPTLPIRIGRGYENDVILDDLHSSAEHVIVDADIDGRMIMRDCDSANGLIYQGRHHPTVHLDGHAVVRLGHTNVRVRGADFPVPDALPDTTSYAWEGWPPALTGLFLIALVTSFSAALTDTANFAVVRYLMTVASVLGVATIWCGLWALANHLFGGHARLGRHLFIVGCGLLAMESWELVGNTIAYAWSLEVFTRYGSHVSMAIAAGMIFFHLQTIGPRLSRRFAMICVFLAVLGSGFMLMNNYQRSGQLADELYMHALSPPALRVSSDRPVAQFLNDAAGLKSQVDAEFSRASDDAGFASDDAE